MSTNRPIPLRVSNKKAHIWDIDDIATLRSKYRLCGVLTGTLPHLTQQNVFLGLPLQLTSEEVVFLVDKGLAIIVNDQYAHHDPSAVEVDKWDEDRLRAIESQITLSEEHDAKEALHPDRAMSVKAILKRKEREEKRNSPTPRLNEVPQHSESTRMTTAELIAPRNSNSTTPYTVYVPGASKFDWYVPSEHSFTTLAAARDAGIWDYPKTPIEYARCGVFRDLWEQGYFLGGGIKFGGEYLVYPGDPLRYHSHFVASVIESPTAPLRPMEIVAHGRLGTGTKKAHLLCEWDEDKKAVTYYSIEWAGFG